MVDEQEMSFFTYLYVIASFILGLLVGVLLPKFCGGKNASPGGQGNHHQARPLVSNISRHYEQQISQSKICSPSSLCSCCKQDKVLFFPDEKDLCQEYFQNLMGNRRYDCRQKPNCRFLHRGEKGFPSSLSQIIEELNNAKSSIDLCIYLITHEKLAEFIKFLKQTRRRVRIITDIAAKPEDRLGDKSLELHLAGIQVKTNPGPGLMHNKIAIIDNKKLIFGSFNWTGSAVTRNNESVLMTEHVSIVPRFRRKFELLWNTFPDYVPKHTD